ncbi:MAG TPA: crotonase/enoyl-CoA hydratase family protein [Nevskiaceae bacterium]|nr:crotonase/enoyl-CoA hydratase family protein [Nevskiaceae bacterium]
MSTTTQRFADRVDVEFDGAIAHVRLSRAERLNAMDRAMVDGLLEAARHVRALPGLRAVVMSGEGRGFCSGIDLEVLDPAKKVTGRVFELDRVIDGGANAPQLAAVQWRDLPVPVIAAVHGFALGAGFQIALGADLRFVQPSAKLGLLEVQWGLVPDMGGIALLRGLVHADVAADLVYSARTFLGTEAKELGIATRVCDDPLADALAFARQLAGRSPDAIRAAKRLLAIGDDGATRERILRAEAREQMVLLDSPNHFEAVAAGLQKRTPRFMD